MEVALRRSPYRLLARWVLAHRSLVVAVCALLTVASVLIGLPPDVDANLVSLLPEDQPEAVALRKLEEETGGSSFITLTFASDDPEALEAFLDELAPRLEALETVSYALHRLEPGLAKQIALSRIDPEILTEVERQVSVLLKMGSILAYTGPPKGLDVEELVADLTREQTELLNGFGAGKVLVRPSHSIADPAFCGRVVDDIEQQITASKPESHGARLEFIAGPYVYIADSSRAVRDDLVATATISLAGVLLVLVVAFRSWRSPLIVLPPLGLAVLVNLALLELFLDSVTTYTSFATAILIGMGIDFAVHLSGRYREERARGLDVHEAIEEAWERTGPSCTMAAITSSAGFLALALGGFRGLAQLGVTLSIGLMLCLLAMLVLLPVLLPILDREPKLLLGTKVRARTTHRRPPFAIPLLIAVLVLTAAVGVWRLPELAFEYDVTAVNRARWVYSEMSDERQALVREAFPPVVVSYDSREEATAEHERLSGLVDAGTLPHVGGVVSLHSLLPEDQQARVDVQRKLVSLSTHKNIRYLPRPIAEKLTELRDFVPQVLEPGDLPPGVLAAVGGGTRVLLIPRGELYDMRESSAFVRELDGVVDGPAGGILAQGALFELITTELPRIALLALFLVSALTALDLRRLLPTVAAVGSLVVGVLWAGVLVELAGVRLSMMNVVGLPILLGIGVDVAIHLSHRLREERGSIRAAYRTVGVAALISTVTTVVSFLSLTGASTGGVRSLGILVTLGLGTVSIVIASLLALFWAAFPDPGLPDGEGEALQDLGVDGSAVDR